MENEKKTIRIERETVMEEARNVEVMMVKVWISKENLDTALTYAAMIKMDDPNCLFGELIKTGMKDIKTKLNNLPYITGDKLIERYQKTQEIPQPATTQL
jgi:hypothetical protein